MIERDIHNSSRQGVSLKLRVPVSYSTDTRACCTHRIITRASNQQRMCNTLHRTTEHILPTSAPQLTRAGKCLSRQLENNNGSRTFVGVESGVRYIVRASVWIPTNAPLMRPSAARRVSVPTGVHSQPARRFLLHFFATSSLILQQSVRTLKLRVPPFSCVVELHVVKVSAQNNPSGDGLLFCLTHGECGRTQL